uniref:Uncharacterized protein n=1 Tax=Bracon brevicornis TaxID=1563983 RepID=A0A6V7LDJ8_9HYME
MNSMSFRRCRITLISLDAQATISGGPPNIMYNMDDCRALSIAAWDIDDSGWWLMRRVIQDERDNNLHVPMALAGIGLYQPPALILEGGGVGCVWNSLEVDKPGLDAHRCKVSVVGVVMFGKRPMVCNTS